MDPSATYHYLNSQKNCLPLIPHEDEKIIPQSADAFRKLWERRKADSGIEDLHFHDTRHEGHLKNGEGAKITGRGIG